MSMRGEEGGRKQHKHTGRHVNNNNDHLRNYSDGLINYLIEIRLLDKKLGLPEERNGADVIQWYIHSHTHFSADRNFCSRLVPSVVAASLSLIIIR